MGAGRSCRQVGKPAVDVGGPPGPLPLHVGRGPQQPQLGQHTNSWTDPRRENGGRRKRLKREGRPVKCILMKSIQVLYLSRQTSQFWSVIVSWKIIHPYFHLYWFKLHVIISKSLNLICVVIFLSLFLILFMCFSFSSSLSSFFFWSFAKMRLFYWPSKRKSYCFYLKCLPFFLFLWYLFLFKVFYFYFFGGGVSLPLFWHFDLHACGLIHFVSLLLSNKYIYKANA